MVRLALRATALAAAILAVAAAEPAGVSGAVTDAGGRALAGVSVQAQSESTGARWRTATDDNGRYSIAPLAPGRYKITVRMEGFHTVSRLGAAVEGSGPA